LLRLKILHCLLFFALALSWGPARAACWQITTTGDQIHRASDVWQIRNKLSGESALLGEVDGQPATIPLPGILSLRIEPPASGWRAAFHGDRVTAVLTRVDGRQARYEGSGFIHAIVGEEEIRLSFRDVRLLETCEELATEPVATLSARASDQSVSPTPPANEGGVDIISLTNGDLLRGKVLSKNIKWRTAFGSIELNGADIKLIDVSSGNAEAGLLEQWGGDRISGTLVTPEISFELTTGQRVSVPSRLLKRITFIRQQ